MQQHQSKAIPHCQKLPHNKESKSQAQSPIVLLLLGKKDTLSLLNQDPWTPAWDTMDQEAQYELSARFSFSAGQIGTFVLHVESQ